MFQTNTARRLAVCSCGLAVAVLAAGAVRAQTGCEPLPPGVAGWWAGDGNGNDVTGNANHASLINGPTFGPGVVGNAFQLDGINDRVEIADAASLRPTRFTLATWIRLDKFAPAPGTCIICKQYGTGGSDSYSLWIDTAGLLRGGMFGFAEAVGSTVVPLNQWLHVATTYDGSIIRLYQDGKLIAAAAGPASAVPYDTNPVLLGAEDNGAGSYQAFVDGLIDEAQVFGRALSSCEIRALYDARPQGHCKGDADLDGIADCQDNCPAAANAGQLDADLDGAGDACDCAPADPAVRAAPGDRDLLRFVSRDGLDWCRDPSFHGTGTVYDVQRGDLHTLPVTSNSATCRSGCRAPLAGLAGWWPGDGNTIDLILGNNGTLENGATFGTGLVRAGFAIDGLNDRVRTGNLTLGNTFSVTAWVNSDAVSQGAYRRIVETSFTTGFYLGTEGTGTGYQLIVKNGSSPYGAARGGKVVPGEWQFVAGTYDGTRGTLYVDGQAVASDSFPAPGTVSLPVNIGAYLGGGNVWKGRIDEVEIYDRSLSASEVRSLYDAGSAGSCKAGYGAIDAEWTAPFAADGAIPVSGRGYWYVYRGRNACGTGPYGSATGGTPRAGAACP